MKRSPKRKLRLGMIPIELSDTINWNHSTIGLRHGESTSLQTCVTYIHTYTRTYLYNIFSHQNISKKSKINLEFLTYIKTHVCISHITLHTLVATVAQLMMRVQQLAREYMCKYTPTRSYTCINMHTYAHTLYE